MTYNAANQVTEVRVPRYFDSTDTNAIKNIANSRMLTEGNRRCQEVTEGARHLSSPALIVSRRGSRRCQALIRQQKVPGTYRHAMDGEPKPAVTEEPSKSGGTLPETVPSQAYPVIRQQKGSRRCQALIKLISQIPSQGLVSVDGRWFYSTKDSIASLMVFQ